MAVFAAIGLGTAAGFALFGTVAIVIGTVLLAFVIVRRRRRAAACRRPQMHAAVAVELTRTGSRS
jgi:threonine/homoserine/homoserine lactone efflux protein